MVEEKVNLSQQKRYKKILSNVVEMNASVNQSKGSYDIKWTKKRVKIFGNKTVLYENWCE